MIQASVNEGAFTKQRECDGQERSFVEYVFQQEGLVCGVWLTSNLSRGCRAKFGIRGRLMAFSWVTYRMPMITTKLLALLKHPM